MPTLLCPITLPRHYVRKGLSQYYTTRIPYPTMSVRDYWWYVLSLPFYLVSSKYNLYHLLSHRSKKGPITLYPIARYLTWTLASHGSHRDPLSLILSTLTTYVPCPISWEEDKS